MARSRFIAVPLLCGTVALLLAAGRADSSSRPPQISHGCPGRFTGYDVRATSLDSVVPVARRVAIDHVISQYQGHAIRRTATNYPVLEVVELDTGPSLPAQQTLRRVAARRCGIQTAKASWAVIFTDTESPVCCTMDIRFVVHLKNGWWVF
jgi:hypothetical protein